MRKSALNNKILCLPFLCCSPKASAYCKFSRNVFTASSKTGKNLTSMFSMSPTTVTHVLALCRHLLAESAKASVMQTYLSSVAAKMYFPFGENLTNDTGGLSSSDHKNMQRGPFYNFGEIWQRWLWTLVKANQKFGFYSCRPVLPMSVFKHCPDAVSQIRLGSKEK